MSKLTAPLVAVVVLLCACATLDDVQVVQDEPTNCTFLGELFEQRECNDILTVFKKQTLKKGGDTLQCCWGGDVFQVLGVNRRTGQVCDYVEGYSARAYSCKAGHNQPLNAIAPKGGAPH